MFWPWLGRWINAINGLRSLRAKETPPDCCHGLAFYQSFPKLKLKVGLLKAMVRPRVSDFVYSELEMEVMAADIDQFKAEGVQGVVIGVLTREGFIDVEKTRWYELPAPIIIDCSLPPRLVARAVPMEGILLHPKR
jgi:hypothetical protein